MSRGRLVALLKSTSAASAAEFALVLPLLLLFLFGIIDAGRFMWEYNRAEKATQAGARLAIVTDPLPSGLIAEDYVGNTYNGTKLAAGDLIPAEALGKVICTSTGCSCQTSPCPEPVGTMDAAIFNDVLVARMKRIFPSIEASNVEMIYSGSGFGFAGGTDSGGGGGGPAPPEVMEISPLITVRVKDVQFRPITTLMFVTVTMPTFSTTLSAEDASGVYSN